MALKASFMAAALAALFVANPSLAQDDSGLSVDDLSWIAGTCRGGIILRLCPHSG